MSNKMVKLLIFLFFILVFQVNWSFSKKNKKTGIRLVGLEKCNLPNSSYLENNPISNCYTYLRKVNRVTTYISSNLTVTRDFGPFWVDITGYQIKKQGTREVVFKLEKMTCKSPIASEFLKTTNMPFDDKCRTKAGIYVTNAFTIDKFAWILKKAIIEPGLFAFQLMFHVDAGVLLCFDFVVETINAK